MNWHKKLVRFLLVSTLAAFFGIGLQTQTGLAAEPAVCASVPRNPYPTITRTNNPKPDHVKCIQNLLSLYWIGSEDPEPGGVYDADTELLIQAFQTENGLTIDGEVGPATWPVLFAKAEENANSPATDGGDEAPLPILDPNISKAGEPVTCTTYPGLTCQPGCVANEDGQCVPETVGGDNTNTMGGAGIDCTLLGLDAQDGLCFPGKGPQGEEGSLVSSKNIGELIRNVVRILLILIGALSVLFLVVGAIMYMTSAGNSGQAEKGKKTMLVAVFGMVVAALAYTMVTIAYNLLTKGAVF